MLRRTLSRARATAWAARPRVRPLASLAGGAASHQFRTLAATFAAIQDSRSSRDTCVALLAQTLRGLLPLAADGSSADVAAALFLTASQLAPPHEGVELRFGAKTFAPVLQRLVGDDASVQWDELLPSLPDYSDAVPLLVQQGALTIGGGSDGASERLSVADVHRALVEIATEQGNGSVQRKQDRAVALLRRCQTEHEAVFVVRLLAHQKLRISMGEKTILSALALACLPQGDAAATDAKAWTEAVATAYSQLPDYHALAAILCALVRSGENLATRTERLLRAAAPRVGVPVLTMAAYPIGSVREAVARLRKSGATRAACEYKYDGARVQLHLSVGRTGRAFSRNMEDHTDRYGSLLDAVQARLRGDVTQLVLEGEAVAVDSETHALLPFQVLQTKAATAVCLFAFDLLSLNGESLIPRPLAERRQRLREVLSPQRGLVELVDALDVDIPPLAADEQDDEAGQRVADEVRRVLEASVAAGCEGLMVKALLENAAYRAGARSFSWMKLKHDYLTSSSCSRNTPAAPARSSSSSGTFLPDTLDLVPIAAFHGKGRRAGVFGSFLLATVDAATGNLETIGKVGSGFSDAQLAQLTEQLRGDVVGGGATIPRGYVAATTAAQRPDVWLAPTRVWEIKATQLTRSPAYTAGRAYLDERSSEPTRTGLALRFPRFVRARPEKTPAQATDSAQVAALFRQQHPETP